MGPASIVTCNKPNTDISRSSAPFPSGQRVCRIFLLGARTPPVCIRDSCCKTLVIMTAHRGICVAAGKMVADNVTHLVAAVYIVSQPLYRSATLSPLLPRAVLARTAPGYRIHTFSAQRIVRWRIIRCDPLSVILLGFERHPETDISYVYRARVRERESQVSRDFSSIQRRIRLQLAVLNDRQLPLMSIVTSN